MWDQYLTNVVTLQYDAQKCIGCQMCTTVCPRAVFEMEQKRAVMINRDQCIECGACMVNCPADAISVRAGVGCAKGILNDALGIQGSDCCKPNK